MNYLLLLILLAARDSTTSLIREYAPTNQKNVLHLIIHEYINHSTNQKNVLQRLASSVQPIHHKPSRHAIGLRGLRRPRTISSTVN